MNFKTQGAARKSYRILRPMLKTAYRYDLIESNPTDKVMYTFEPKKYVPRTLDKQEVTQLINGFRGHDLEAFVIVTVSLGLRKEEACALL